MRLARLAAAGVGLLAALLLTLPVFTTTARADDDGWVIRDFHSDLRVAGDTSMTVTETVAADFGQQQKHGIYRNLRVLSDYDARNYRKLDVSVRSVTDGSGQAVPYQTSQSAPDLQIKIGDPNRTVTGLQTYVLTYTVRGGVRSLPNQDELYWNVNGDGWPVTAQRVSAVVSLPGPDLQRAACYEGANGSRQACQHTERPDGADYVSTVPLSSGQQLTVVAGVRKSALLTPPLLLQPKPRPIADAFQVGGGTGIAALAIVAAGLVLPGLGLWRGHRDRALLRQAERGGEGPEAPETTPPEGMRPAQMTQLLDRATPSRVWTATISDLAARGYLTIDDGRQPSGGVQAAAPPRLSGDGAWWWTGTQWVRTLSKDGRWRWDGARWVATTVEERT